MQSRTEIVLHSHFKLLFRLHNVQLFLSIDLHPPGSPNVDAAAVSHQLVVRTLLVHGATRRSKGLLEVILGPRLLQRVGGDWE